MCGHGFAVTASIEARRYAQSLEVEPPPAPAGHALRGRAAGASLLARSACPSSRLAPVGAPRSVRLAPQGLKPGARCAQSSQGFLH